MVHAALTLVETDQATIKPKQPQDNRKFKSEPLFDHFVLKALHREEKTSDAYIYGKGTRKADLKAMVALARAIDRWKRDLLLDDEMIERYKQEIKEIEATGKDRRGPIIAPDQ